MSKDSAEHSTYHHGDLRAALVRAARAEIERSGYENLSLRELAASIGVSRAAPYRHFDDRRALLAAIAAEGFEELTALHRKAIVAGKNPQTRLVAAGRSYLAFAAERPQLFRLMFASDLLTSPAPRDPALIKSAGESYAVLEEMVAATLDDPDDRAIKAATIALMSSTYGFALLRMSGRLKPFMYGALTPEELVDAVLSLEVTWVPGAGERKRRGKS